MITSRLAILLAVLLGGLSTIFLLPRQHTSQQPVGVHLQLPEYIGEWYGSDLQVTERERQVLGPETEFARKAYSNGRGDEIHLSVVLGGQDMNTSIHRPERCLPAQGWTVTDSKALRVAVPKYGGVPVTRLQNLRNLPGADEKPIPLYNLNYYWFAGHRDLTGSHLERTFIDIRDRVLRGYNQRWAYITVSGTITQGLKRFGRSEKEVDALIQDFIRQVAPRLHAETIQPG
jgi:EpsI family protein